MPSRYSLDTLLGRGGLGEVWSATHASGRRVAFKRLRSDRPGDAAAGATLLREASATARLQHPAVVQVLDLGRDEGRPFVVMELARGALREGAAASWSEARDLLLDLLSALAHVHARGVVHLDLKPGNLLRFDAAPRLRISDFGAAALAREPEHERWLGTLGYAAPEQLLGEPVGPTADLYALGCLATLLLTGRRPFPELEGEDLFEAHIGWAPAPLRPCFEVPPEVEGWVARLLEKDPSRRFQRAAEAARALGRSLPCPAGRRPPPLGAEVAALRVAGLLGRPVEQEALLLQLGRPGHLRVRGPSGSGRSALARWLLTEAHEHDLARSALVELDDDSPTSAAVGRTLAALLDLRGLDPPEARQQLLLRVACAEHLSARDRPALLGLLGLASAPLLQPAHLAGLLLRTLREVAGERPLVVVLDGLERQPDAAEMVAPLVTGGALVVSTVAEDRGGAVGAADLELTLGPLEEHALRALLTERAGLEPRSALKLAERSGGNPLLASQLLSVCLEQGLLEERPDGFALRADAEPRLPADVQAIWQRRIADLVPETQRPALGLAAVLGARVDAATWRLLCDQEGLAPTEVQPLLDAGLLQPYPRGFSFAQGLLRTATLALFPDRLPRWHALAAEHAEKPAVRGHHLLAAGRVVDGARDLLAANLPLLRGRHELRASMVLDELDPLPLPPDARAEVARQRAWVAVTRRDPRAVDLARQAVALAADGASSCRALLQLASALTRAGRAEEGDAARRRAAGLARAHGVLDVLREALIGEATVRIRAGELAAAEALLREAEASCGPSHDLLNARAWLALKSGQLPGAARAARRVLGLPSPSPLARYSALTYLAEVARLEDRPEEAEAHLVDAIEVAEAAGLRGSAWVARASLGILAAQRGATARARALLEGAVEVFSADHRRAVALICRAWLAGVHRGAERAGTVATLSAELEELELHDAELVEALLWSSAQAAEHAETLRALAERARPTCPAGS
ncbi:MAG: protein kinase [Alphaproteobacteria bacterium]|nr:protein kinase [Alphaproteobacteria bacterium]